MPLWYINSQREFLTNISINQCKHVYWITVFLISLCVLVTLRDAMALTPEIKTTTDDGSIRLPNQNLQTKLFVSKNGNKNTNQN